MTRFGKSWNNPFELDGERLYEVHDVSRALKALNLSWPEGLSESTTGGGVADHGIPGTFTVALCLFRPGSLARVDFSAELQSFANINSNSRCLT